MKLFARTLLCALMVTGASTAQAQNRLFVAVDDMHIPEEATTVTSRPRNSGSGSINEPSTPAFAVVVTGPRRERARGLTSLSASTIPSIKWLTLG